MKFITSSSEQSKTLRMALVVLSQHKRDPSFVMKGISIQKKSIATIM